MIKNNINFAKKIMKILVNYNNNNNNNKFLKKHKINKEMTNLLIGKVIPMIFLKII